MEENITTYIKGKKYYVCNDNVLYKKTLVDEIQYRIMDKNAIIIKQEITGCFFWKRINIIYLISEYDL